MMSSADVSLREHKRHARPSRAWCGMLPGALSAPPLCGCFLAAEAAPSSPETVGHP